MKFAKFIILFVLVVLLLIFVIQNLGQQVTLKFFSISKTFTTEMIIVMLLAIVVGFLLGFLLAGVEILSAKNKIRVLGTEYKKLKEEVDHLRNQNIEETLGED